MNKLGLTMLLLLFSSSLFAGVGLNAKIGYGASTVEGETEGVLCYGGEVVIFSDIMLCSSIGFDAWHWSDEEGSIEASITNSSIIVSLGVAFPKKKPVASIRGGTGLVTWWNFSLSSGGTSMSITETMSFKDIFGVFDLYVPISRQFDILFQGKFVHQTVDYEAGGSDSWNTFSGKVGLQVKL